MKCRHCNKPRKNVINMAFETRGHTKLFSFCNHVTKNAKSIHLRDLKHYKGYNKKILDNTCQRKKNKKNSFMSIWFIM